MHPYQDPEKCEMSHELVACAARGDMASVENLLNTGIDPNQRGVYRETALHWAAAHGDQAMARRLIDAGAYAAAATYFGDSPSSIARDFHHPELAAHLEDFAKRESVSPAEPRSHKSRLSRSDDAGRSL
ncbi:MAG: ankyrin repeat domain-containing protein [Phycisphaerales bacterium]